MVEKATNRKIVIVLDECSRKCPYFVIGEGRGHCDDWSDCSLAKRRIHEDSNQYCGKFPEFCPLKKTTLEPTPDYLVR